MNGHNYKYFYIIADLFIFAVGFLVCSYILTNEADISLYQFSSNSFSLLGFALLLALINIFIFEVNSLYQINVILSRSRQLSQIIKSMYYGFLNIILVAILLNVDGKFDSKYLMILFPLLVIPLFLLVRIGLLRYIYLRIGSTKVLRNILIVGNGRFGKLLAAKLIFENPIGINIVGFVNTGNDNSQVIFGQKYLGGISNIDEIVSEHNVSEILLSLDGIDHKNLLEILDKCKSTDAEVKVSSELFKVIPEKVPTEEYIDIPVVNISKTSNNQFTLSLKRLFDFVFTLFAVILFAPSLLMIALLIKLTSKGPIIYKQTRIGKDGKPFDFLKFRTMKMIEDDNDEERKKEMIEFMKNGEQSSGQKIVNENRITSIGKFLRKTSLDELPQLFNVLKGEMSLVGPRPCLPYEYENYNEWQKRRTSVIPGCTGVWQVMGRSSVSFNDSVIMDIYYINNMSPWFDLELILKTIPTMLLAKGGK